MTTRLSSVLWPLDVFGNGVEQVFRDALRGFPTNGPIGIAADLWEDEDSYHVEVSVPGLKTENIDVSLDGRRLVLKGNSPEVSDDTARTWHYRERLPAKFERVFTLPGQVNAEAIVASLDNGVLHLTLPKAEADKPRRIVVKGA
jgi:HSP20 family protein